MCTDAEGNIIALVFSSYTYVWMKQQLKIYFEFP